MMNGSDASGKVYDSKYKVVVMGMMGAGKSSLLTRLVYNIFDGRRVSSSSSVGLDFMQHVVRVSTTNDRVILQLWDTAGQERFATMPRAYYKDAHAILFVYDATDTRSLKYAHEEIERLSAENSVQPLRVLVGTKTDLPGAVRTESEARVVMTCHDLDSNDRCSSFDGSGVAETFDRLATKLMFSSAVRELNEQREREQSTMATLREASAYVSSAAPCCRR